MLLRELIEQLKSNGVQVMQTTGSLDVDIARVVEDSRKVQPGDLFVAKSGTKVSGAQFVADAIARGAVAIVTQEAPSAEINASGVHASACVVVNDIALALGILSHAIHNWPGRQITCIGITGTKGKTTVAYLLRSVLRAAGKTCGMIGTVEIDDGKTVVESDMTTPGPVEMAGLLAKMRDNGVTHCVMEVSSHALHQKRVAGIDFKVAIFTNLTGDHLDYHKTMEEYAAAKALLFEGLKEDAVAVVNADDKWVSRIVDGCKANVVRFGIAPRPSAGSIVMPERLLENGCTSLIWKMTSEGMGVTFAWDRSEAYSIESPLVGRHNCYNLTAVMAATGALGLRGPKVARSIGAATGAPGRLQRVTATGGFSVFVDYAHTHDALENVLNAVRATMPSEGNLICVFGCGGDRDRTKRPKMGAIAQRLADKAIVTSDNPRTENPDAIIEEICAGFTVGWRTGGKISVEPDRRAAIQMAIAMAEAGDVVLIAGKGHENYQIIGKTKHHFDDVEEASAAMQSRLKFKLQTERTKL